MSDTVSLGLLLGAVFGLLVLAWIVFDLWAKRGEAEALLQRQREENQEHLLRQDRLAKDFAWLRKVCKETVAKVVAIRKENRELKANYEAARVYSNKACKDKLAADSKASKLQEQLRMLGDAFQALTDHSDSGSKLLEEALAKIGNLQREVDNWRTSYEVLAKGQKEDDVLAKEEFRKALEVRAELIRTKEELAKAKHDLNPGATIIYKSVAGFTDDTDFMAVIPGCNNTFRVDRKGEWSHNQITSDFADAYVKRGWWKIVLCSDLKPRKTAQRRLRKPHRG